MLKQQIETKPNTARNLHIKWHWKISNPKDGINLVNLGTVSGKGKRTRLQIVHTTVSFVKLSKLKTIVICHGRINLLVKIIDML